MSFVIIYHVFRYCFIFNTELHSSRGGQLMLAASAMATAVQVRQKMAANAECRRASVGKRAVGAQPFSFFFSLG